MDLDIFTLIISSLSLIAITFLLWLTYNLFKKLKSVRSEVTSLKDMLQDDFVNNILKNKDKRIKTGKGIESNILKSVLFEKGLENAGNIAEMKRKKLEKENK